MLIPWKESYDQSREHIKKQRHNFVNKDPSSQGYGFSSSHVYMWELDYKESWALKNLCFWTVVLEKTLEICKEIQPVQDWSPLGWTDWIFWLDLKSLLQHHSSKASILRCSAFVTVQLSHPYMTTGKTIALTRWTFVGKVMSLLLNMLSRLVITFLPRSTKSRGELDNGSQTSGS